MSLTPNKFKWEDRCYFFGGDSDTSSETTNIVETNQAGIDSVDGLGIASLGDVDLEIQTTDLGAVQGAFDFAQDFSDSALMFANDSQSQAADLSERALETAQTTAATAVTGGASDLAGINAKVIAFIMVGLVAISLLPKLFKGK